MSRRIRARDGREWRIGRRWAPRAPRWRSLRRRRGERKSDASFLDAAFDGEDFLFAVGIILALVFLVAVGVPLLLFLFDLLVAILLVVLGLVAKIVFRRPWTVEAETDGPPGEVRRWRIVGLRASGRAIAEIERALRAGRTPPERLAVEEPRAPR